MIKLSSCLRFDPKINWPMSSPKLFQDECSQSFWASWACAISMHQLEGECCDIGLIVKDSLL